MHPALMASALLGLASIPHCAAMCGPVAVYASTGPRGGWGYHLGRGAAYLLLGGVAGAFGGTLTDVLPGRVASALLSWTLAASLGWTAYRLWRRDAAPRGQGTPSLVTLGRTPRAAGWRARAFTVLPRHPITLGLITGVLPCGALYSALLVAAGAGDGTGGAAAMGVFGAASALGLLVIGSVATQIRKRIRAGRDARVLARVLAAGLLVGAVVLAVRPIPALQAPAAPPACHTPG